MTLVDRRRFSAVACAAATASLASARSASSAGPTRISVTQAVTALSYIQSYVAREKGFFAQEGLSAELVDTGGGGPDVQLVLSGRADMTVNDGAQVLPALQREQPLRCVLSLLNRSIVNATMRKEVAGRLGVTDASPIGEKLRTLKGLKIGVTRPGALTWQQARFNLVSAGLNPDRDAEIVGIGGASALAAALEFGKVDVIYISMPVGERLVREGKAVTLVDNARGEDAKLPSFIMEGLWATPDYIAKNRATLSAAVKAYRKASVFIIETDVQDVVAALRPTLGSLGGPVLEDSVRRMKPAISRSGRIEKADLDATQDLLKTNGVLKQRFDLPDVFDASFITA